MNNIVTDYVWNFPGGILFFLLLIVLSIAVIFFSYKFTLKDISAKKKTLLISIRILLIAAVLYILGDPKKTVKRMPTQNTERKIAVIFDKSSSMNKTAFSGSTRLKDALKSWKNNFLPATEIENSKISYFAFDTSFKSIKKPEYLLKLKNKTTTATALYDSIVKWNQYLKNKNYSAVFCFTDGNDVTDHSPENAVRAIESSLIPHFFVPVTTPLPTLPYASFFRLESPTTAKVGSTVIVKAVITTANISPSDELKLTVRENSKEICSKTFQVKTDKKSTQTISFPVKITKEGTHIFEACLNYPVANTTISNWSIEGIKNEKIKILMFQGGLDWGTRFLRSVTALENGKFSMDVKFAKGSFGPTKLYVKNLFASFPDADELKKYNLVIMTKMKHSQLTQKIEQDLHDFVNNGGALLFIIANTIYASEFANSPIEKLLPVVFENLNEDNGSKLDSKTSKFLTKMKKFRNNTIREISFKSGDKSGLSENNNDVPPLTPMKLTDEGKNSPIFNYLKSKNSDGQKMVIPEFQDFALITNPKPGASVLAVHPELTKNNKGRVLLAIQKYGKGRTSVLATDPLWRWKLSVSSKNQSFFKFWSQLLEWLAAGGNNSPYWIIPSATVKTKQPFTVKFKIPAVANISSDDIEFSYGKLHESSLKHITMQKISSEMLKTSLTPPIKGSYKLSAYFKKSQKNIAEAVFYASDSSDDEIKLLKPSNKNFTALTIPFNSTLQDINSKFNISNIITHKKLLTNRAKTTEIPLWNKNWIFLLILLLFLSELTTRRIFKLL